MADSGDLAAAFAEKERCLALSAIKVAVKVMSSRLRVGAVCCSACNRPISTGRLLAVPGAVLCFDCQVGFEEAMRGHYG